MPRCSQRGGRCLAAGALLLLLLSGGELRPQGAQQAAQIEAVKQGILARLGLQGPPTLLEAPGQDVVKKAQRLYREALAQLRGNQTRRPAATAVHRLTPKLTRMPAGEAPAGLPASTGPLYSLELSRTASLPHGPHVLRAELAMFKQLLGLPGVSQANFTWPVRVHVYQLGGAAPELLSSQEISVASQTLSLQGAVERWLAGPEPGLRLGLTFSPDVGPWPEGTAALPLLLVTREQGRRRRARQLEQEECAKGDGKCCMRSLKVSFEAIGWADWVVAPRSYSMRFCEGSCPHNYKPASMHAQIKARLHSLSGETPAPCCVPAAYEPMVLMHYSSDGGVATQLFEDMIVTRCHCA
ncbi:growth/differentiation factor 15 [Varanus komodoensis]|uniref:growth/differentiation factor 15 n=1 Tax=Varanus komodoensis TaxID=61221 RepID=UPI001CF77990|nr:growth/differentiation factor 15 [Varanus komodoensis]